jgi:hypothetical protein
VLREGIGRDAMKHIDDLASQMRAEEERLFVARTTNADRSQSLAASMTWVGSSFVVVLAGISIFLVRRSARARDDAEASLRDNNLNLEATIDERTPIFARPTTRSSASPILSATICARRW